MPDQTSIIVVDHLGNDLSSFTLIDTRPVDAYNGWRMRDERRGGHIPGARSLPFKWAKYIDWLDIVKAKMISTKEALLIYGYEKEEIDQVAMMFVRAGFKDVSVYYYFIEDWVNDDGKKMELLPRYRHLVYAEWLQKIMKGEEVSEYNNDHFVLLHAHYRNREAYLSGHIPGAIDINTNDVESTTTWNRRSPEELKNVFESHGITADTTVVLYGKFMTPNNDDDYPGSAAGHIGAIRTAFIMLWAGVKDVRILNGGFQAWKDGGYEISTEDVAKKPVKDFGADIPGRPELAVDVPEAKKMLAAKDADLVCVRSWPEYIGEVSGYNYIEKKGRIPGAIFGNCGSDAYHMENYRNLDHSIREAAEVEAIWKENGITPEKHLAFYCGTGWRGSEAFFNAWLMGWPRVSVFDGGWFEWSSDPKNHYETGLPGD